MKKALFTLAILATSSSWAALSPYYDSLEKIQAVLGSHPLSGDTASSITSITEVRRLVYEVVAGACSTQVTLKAHAPGRPGKTTYEVDSVLPATCLP